MAHRLIPIVKFQQDGLSKDAGKAYKRFCRLGEALISIKDREEPGLQFKGRREATKKILEEMANDDNALRHLRVLGNSWYGWSKRSQDGILLVGKVGGVEEEGGFFATTLKMNKATVVVISKDPPKIEKGETALVLGAIVEDPVLNLAGYMGEAKKVVWAELLLKPEGKRNKGLR